MTMDNASRSAFGAEATELVPGATPSLVGISLWIVSGRGSISVNGLALSHLLHLKPLESKKQHPADVRRSYRLEVARTGVLIFPTASTGRDIRRIAGEEQRTSGKFARCCCTKELSLTRGRGPSSCSSLLAKQKQRTKYFPSPCPLRFAH